MIIINHYITLLTIKRDKSFQDEEKSNPNYKKQFTEKMVIIYYFIY